MGRLRGRGRGEELTGAGTDGRRGIRVIQVAQAAWVQGQGSWPRIAAAVVVGYRSESLLVLDGFQPVVGPVAPRL